MVSGPQRVNVEPLKDYRLRVSFDDGIEGEADLSHLVGQGVFALWNDPREFAKVAIGSGGELTWGGRVDLCPDALYQRITGKTPEDLFPRLRELAQHA